MSKRRRYDDEWLRALISEMKPGEVRDLPGPTEIDATTRRWMNSKVPREQRIEILARQSDRLLATDGSEIINELLCELLRDAGVEDPPRLFGHRINKAIQIGLVPRSLRKWLTAISKVRASFAHDTSLHGFDWDEDVQRRIETAFAVQMPSGIPLPLRDRYWMMLLATCKELEGISKGACPPNP